MRESPMSKSKPEVEASEVRARLIYHIGLSAKVAFMSSRILSCYSDSSGLGLLGRAIRPQH